jgi:hypothetical protein
MGRCGGSDEMDVLIVIAMRRDEKLGEIEGEAMA